MTFTNNASLLKRVYLLSCGALLGLCTAGVAIAQVNTINGVVVTPRVFNDVPSATFFDSVHYPWLWMAEQGVSSPTGFANRDAWQFSANNGVSAYQFQNSDYFSASFNLTLGGLPISPRKEAGFLLSSSSVGDIQFIVNTDGHEVVQFGGISFYSFSGSQGLTYNSGDTIHLGMNYFMDGAGRNALQFFANNLVSPVFEFAAGQGIGNGSTLGGYFQIVNDPNNPNNSGYALYQNINITPIPEPSTAVLLSLGGLAFLFRRRLS